MDKEFKEALKKAVSDALDEDVLSDYDIGTILVICKKASERKIAEATEEYLAGMIGGNAQ